MITNQMLLLYGWDLYTGSAIPFTTTAVLFATALECVYRLKVLH